MKIALVIPGIPRSSGGPGIAVAAMASKLRANGHSVTVITTDQKAGDGLLRFPSSIEVQIFPLDRWAGGPLLRSSALNRWLERQAGRFDVIDIQGVWSFVTADAARICWKRGIPYVLTPHGQAARWDQKKARWKKGCFFGLVLRRLWREAVGVRFLSEGERQTSWLPQPRWSVVVPNWSEDGLVRATESVEVLRRRLSIPAGAPVLLFLGRIDPQKGVVEILEAFERIWPEFPGIYLLLVGPGHGSYLASVRARCERSKAKENIRLTGPLYGEEKNAAFVLATLFVTLSKNEACSIAMLEALKQGIPILTTEEANLPEIKEYEAGMVVDASPVEVAGAISTLLEDEELRERMAGNAKRLFAERFSVEAVFPKLMRFYEQAASTVRGQALPISSPGGAA